MLSKFEDTKGVIRIRKSKKNRQHNDEEKHITCTMSSNRFVTKQDLMLDKYFNGLIQNGSYTIEFTSVFSGVH
jgi:hypothetical protein